MRKTFALLALLIVVLGSTLPQIVVAQGPVPERAPRPIDVPGPAPVTAPDWGGTWQYGPDTTFAFTRFDSGYYPGDGMIYFLGGRLADGNTDGSIWSLDPGAGTYADTGVDMVTPISNYTVNLLQDATGWGLYTVCGRPAAGGVTAAVQAYYPDTNTAVQLDPADNYPGTGSCTSGLNAVYDNKVYVAGGFDGTANHAETWVFDPMGAVGSKWTQIPTANLGIARAYIMGVVVDDMIYAVGGNFYDASSTICGQLLCDVETVEVLDPNDPAPVWDDAAAADLPSLCSSSRAWGFDSDSPYVDPDGTSLAGKIVSGCGGWPDEGNLVYVYDSNLDFWEAFPTLQTDRRDMAGDFAGDALWVWGGRQDSDANVLVSSEYYGLNMAGACSVLLVDDDWDFDQTVPNDGGRPYYTSTLDSLGYTYDVWDTITQGTPTSGYMDAYDVVIWFTGYDWQTPISPTEEPELIAYLDNGGSLMMSSQEQEYAFPGSTIMTDYFWVGSVTEDVVLTETVGNAADPLFTGLGPYMMDRPDQWAAYWPTDNYQGPYDDEVTVKAGGFEPMLYTDSGNPNSTRFEGAGFKTVYLAYPFEWLPQLADREAVLSATLGFLCPGEAAGNFQLIPPGQVGGGVPGAMVPYTLTVVNNLGYAESFTLTYVSSWAIDGPTFVGPVDDAMTADFVVTVTVPTDVNCYDADIAAVTAWAHTDMVSKTAYIETTADPPGVGDVTGVVYDANTNLGIPDAYVYLELGAYDYYETWADAAGLYTMTNVPICNYDGGANAVGYFTRYFAVMPPGALDIYLDAGWPDLSHDAVSVVVPPDSTYTVTMTLTNTGTADLFFHTSELPEDAIYPEAYMPRGIDSQVYADLAAAADGTARFVVYMAEQADLTAAFGMTDWAARGQYVLETLRSTAARSQAGLLAELDRAGVSYESRYLVNAVVVEGNLALANNLIARPEVAFIGPDRVIEAPEPVEMTPAIAGADVPVWNVAQIRADDVWTMLGVTGTGVVVSNIDTGVLYTHTALVDGYRGNAGGGTFDHNYNWWDPYGDMPDYPYDWDSHGSHTIGTMAGGDFGGEEIGIAPGAQWIACNGFDHGGSGYTAELLECAEFLLAPWDLTGANPDPAMRPHVINNSWGGGGADWWYNQAIYAWRAAGIIGIFSAGNRGPTCETIGAPDYGNVMLVGATDNTDTIASFSSRGPADVSGLMKPDVSAPGVGVLSAYNDGTIGGMSGTSMAAPHVAGLAALIWSAQPELIGNVELTYWLIEQTAIGITTTDGCGGDLPTDIPNNTYGWGRIDAYEAVSLALSANWDIPWLMVEPVQGTVAPGGNETIDLVLYSTGLISDTCYTGTLMIEYNDPYVMQELLALEMCVAEPTPPTFTIYLPIVTRGYE